MIAPFAFRCRLGPGYHGQACYRLEAGVLIQVEPPLESVPQPSFPNAAALFLEAPRLESPGLPIFVRAMDLEAFRYLLRLAATAGVRPGNSDPTLYPTW